MNNMTASLLTIPARVRRKLVEFPDDRGQPLPYLYFSLNPLDDRDMNVAAIIGMLAVADITRLKLPLGLMMDQLPRVVHEGVMFLAMDINNWSFTGRAEDIATAKDLIGAGTDSLRRHRIEQLLGIFERPADRYLAINLQSERTAFSDIGAEFAVPRSRTTVVLDAFAFANDVRLAQPGSLFLLKVSEP